MSMRSTFFIFWLGYTLVYSQNFRFKNLSVNEGLSHSDVISITTDENGLIWLATNSGLNRFDGYDLKVFKNDLLDSLSLPNNRISKVVSNHAGRLYMLSGSKEVFIYDIISDRFWSVESEGGSKASFEELFSQGKDRYFLRSNQNRIFEIIEQGEVTTLKELFKLNPDLEILSSHHSDKRFFFLSDEREVVTFYEETREFQNLQDYRGVVLGWSNSNKENPLIVTTEGIYTISADTLAFKIPLVLDHSQAVSDVVRDGQGGFWIAYHYGGISHHRFNGKEITAIQYGQDNVLSTDRINDLEIDEFGEMWIATSGAGMYHASLLSKPFFTINTELGYNLPDNYVTAITSQNNDLWVGTRTGLTRIEDFKKRKSTSTIFLEGKHISRIFINSSGLMLVGTRREGLFIANVNNPKFSKVSQISANEISSVASDHYGRIWVTSFNQGIEILDMNDLSVIDFKTDAYLPARITYLFMDQEKPTVWLGTFDEGLFSIDISDSTTNRINQYQSNRKENGAISSNYIWPIEQTQDGSLWVGTIGGGLNYLPFGEAIFESFTVNEGLPDNDIESVILDDSGRLWMGGKGLSVFDPKKKEVMQNYYYEDGLQSNSFKIGASHKSADGTLFFGGINGLNYFQPDEIEPNKVKPILVLDQLSILGTQIEVDQTFNERKVLEKNLNSNQRLTFHSDQNEFTISLLAVHHTNPDKNRYAYKLVGYNEDWVELSSKDRNITFANLKRGTYSFQAKVSNGDGYWSDIKELEIIILPPWYLTWWALFGYFIVIFLLLLSYRYLIQRQTHLQKDLILSESENQKNEDRLTLFTNISHEIRTPLTLIKGPIEDLISEGDFDTSKQSELLIVNKNVDRLLRLSNQLLDFRKYESGQVQLYAAAGDFLKFVKEICVLFEAEARRRNITLSFKPSSDKVLLTYDRDKLEIVLANLLANAIKFTNDNGQINVILDVVGNDSEDAVFRSGKLSKNYLQISISDTGKGMSREEVKKVFDRFYQIASLNQLDIRGTGIGLALVKNIVLQHKGEIELKSKESIGSTFTIKFPFGNGHLNENEVLSDFKDSESIASFDTFKLPSEEVTQEKNTTSRSDLKKPLVLVMEDNDDVAQYICKSLNHAFRTKHAKNGSIGLAKAEELLPDIIVSDVMMPEMDGIEMLNQIRNNHNISFIPVILLTARTSTLYEVQGIQTGAQDYITKPFNPKILSAKILSILEVRKSYRKYYLKSLKNGASEEELPSAEYQFIENLRTMVLDNLNNEEFSVGNLVKMVGMSQSAFYKRVKELTDRSVVQFIRDVRLKKASDLLRKEDLTISQVAYAVGINDHKYFREKFRELFGVNPKEFREKIKAQIREITD